MKIAKFITGREEHKEDIQRLKDVFASYGILIPENDLVYAWEQYSEDNWAAGWISLPEKDEEVYLAIIKMFQLEEW